MSVKMSMSIGIATALVLYACACAALHVNALGLSRANPMDRGQRGILDQLFSSISGFFGGSAVTPAEAASSQIVHDDIIITPPPFPAIDNPHYKPGTTTSGGVVNHIVAAVSGITSGLFGAIGANNEGPVHFLQSTTTKPSPILSAQGSLGISKPNQDFLSPIYYDKSQNILPELPELPQLPTLNLPIPEDPFGNIVNSILNQASGCNEIRRLMGRC